MVYNIFQRKRKLTDLESKIAELDSKKKSLVDAIAKAKIGKEDSVSCLSFCLKLMNFTNLLIFFKNLSLITFRVFLLTLFSWLMCCYF